MKRPPGRRGTKFPALQSCARRRPTLKWPSLRGTSAMNRAAVREDSLFIDGRPDRSMVPCRMRQSGTGFRMVRLSKNASRKLPLEWDVVSRWCFAERCIPLWAVKWDTFPKALQRELRPIIRSETGCIFPMRAKPEIASQSALKSGTPFPNEAQAENASRNLRSKVGCGFPVEGLRGKCVPESTLEMGCSFPMRHSTENTSQKMAFELG